MKERSVRSYMRLYRGVMKGYTLHGLYKRRRTSCLNRRSPSTYTHVHAFLLLTREPSTVLSHLNRLPSRLMKTDETFCDPRFLYYHPNQGNRHSEGDDLTSFRAERKQVNVLCCLTRRRWEERGKLRGRGGHRGRQEGPWTALEKKQKN